MANDAEQVDSFLTTTFQSNTLNDQLSRRQLPRRLKSVKSNFVISLIAIITIAVTVINITLQHTNENNTRNSTNNNSPTIEWSLKDSIIPSNYTNCLTQYTLGYNLRLTICQNEQYGEIIDIRYFLNDKGTIKGIVLPKMVIFRLLQILPKIR